MLVKRALIGVAYAIAGLALAVGLTLGAYTVAGRDLSKPAQPVRVTVPLAPPEASPTSTARPDDHPSPDDRGTDDRSGRGRGGGGSGDDSGSGSNSGHGSGDD